MTLARRINTGTKRRTINIGGDDITIIHVGFEVSETGWEKFRVRMKEKYGDKSDQKKSQAMRILVNATNLGIIDLSDLEKKIERAAEHVKEVVYL